MLLDYGMGKQASTWHVLESKAPMFSRIYYIIGGRTQYQSMGIPHMLNKNWLYIFPAHAPYEMQTDPEDPMECLYLHLDLRAADLSRLISVDLEKAPELTNLIRTLRDAVTMGCPAEYVEKLSECFEMLCRIKGIVRGADEETARLMRALRAVYRTNVPLSQVAAGLGYSNEYFIRLFRRKLGLSPHQYVIRLRMGDAVRMLSRGAGLEEIAGAVGYADSHSFSNSFRRYYGISPGEYRKHYTGSV